MATSMQIHIARRVQLIHTKQPHRILLVRHALLEPTIQAILVIRVPQIMNTTMPILLAIIVN